MTDFGRLISSKACVVVLDSVDPHCHMAADLINKLPLNNEQVEFVYVDKADSGKEIAEASKDHVRKEVGDDQDDSFPHVFLGGSFFFAGQEMGTLQNEASLRNAFAAVEAVTLPGLEKVQQLIKDNKLVVFQNSFSTYCLSVPGLLGKYVKDGQMVPVYTDADEEGPMLEHASLFLAGLEKLPAIFCGGKSIGSFRELKQLSDDFQLYDLLADSGVIRTPAHEELQALRTAFKILLIGNDYSAYSFQGVEILERLMLPAGVLRMVTDGSNNNEDLEIAAKISSKQNDGPFLYLNGELVVFMELVDADKNHRVQDFLKEKGAL